MFHENSLNRGDNFLLKENFIGNFENLKIFYVFYRNIIKKIYLNFTSIYEAIIYEFVVIRIFFENFAELFGTKVYRIILI